MAALGADPEPALPHPPTVADELYISMVQAYALIRRGGRAAKIGGRGDYRIGRDDLEAYIDRTYEVTARWVKEHPYNDTDAG